MGVAVSTLDTAEDMRQSKQCKREAGSSSRQTRLPETQLASLIGRADDVLQTPDGRRIGRLDPVFKADLAIREAQIVQERLDFVRVLVVPADGFAERDAALIREGLRSRLGPGVRIHLETVPLIARSANGKFRAVVSRVARGQEL